MFDWARMTGDLDILVGAKLNGLLLEPALSGVRDGVKYAVAGVGSGWSSIAIAGSWI